MQNKIKVRAFIHLNDTIRCILRALENPPQKGDLVAIFNQMTETYRLIDLTHLVSRLTKTPIDFKVNPRAEAIENELAACHDKFKNLGHEGLKIVEGALTGISQTVTKYQANIDETSILCKAVWNEKRRLAMAEKS